MYKAIFQESPENGVRFISFSNKKYLISDDGNVYSANKMLTKQINKQGYEKIQLKINGICKNYFVHRLVALHFIPNPEYKATVNHINGIKCDNRVENLEWATQKENNNHAIKEGLTNFNHLKLRTGKNHSSSKAVVQLSKNYEFIKEWESASECETQTKDTFKFYQSHINNCANGKPKYKNHKGFIWMYRSDYDNFLQSRKKIQSRIQDAIKLDHLENPCVSDSIFTTTQGETLVLIDTVRTTTTDTLTQTDTLKTTITITKHRTDTIMAVVLDKRGLKDAADSIARYKLLEAHLRGQYAQQAQTLAEAKKKATNLLYGLFGLCVAIVVGVVLWIKSKVPFI